MTRDEQRKQFWTQHAGEHLDRQVPREPTPDERAIAQLHEHPGWQALTTRTFKLLHAQPMDYAQPGWEGRMAHLNGKRELLDNLMLAVETANRRVHAQPLAYQEVPRENIPAG